MTRKRIKRKGRFGAQVNYENCLKATTNLIIRKDLSKCFELNNSNAVKICDEMKLDSSSKENIESIKNNFFKNNVSLKTF